MERVMSGTKLMYLDDFLTIAISSLILWAVRLAARGMFSVLTSGDDLATLPQHPYEPNTV
jgi:hypothetical protein